MRAKKYGKTAHEEIELRPNALSPNDSPPPHKTNINKIKNTSEKTGKNKPEDSTRTPFQCWATALQSMPTEQLLQKKNYCSKP